jgi:hypothetical protein
MTAYELFMKNREEFVDEIEQVEKNLDKNMPPEIYCEIIDRVSYRMLAFYTDMVSEWFENKNPESPEFYAEGVTRMKEVGMLLNSYKKLVQMKLKELEERK